MNFQDYQDLTGITCSSSQETKIYATIARTQAILENLLGFSLDPALVDENEYTEAGQLTDSCPCLCTDVDDQTLLPADPVEFAYRLFPYHAKDAFLAIDPATAIHSVKLVKNGVTYRTLDTDDYNVTSKRGIIKFLEQCHRWCACRLECDCVQLAVDAEWMWQNDADGNPTLPLDLQVVWADMVTYYSDGKRDIKRESLGPHTYERFDREKPESISANLAIIKRYAGPNGTAIQMPN